MEPVRDRRPRAVLTALRVRRRAQRRFRRGVYLLPSMFTVGNLFCGYACVVYSMRGEFATAGFFVIVAIVLDMLDGRIARLTGTSSAFGLEFDSLADVISFGIAPAVLALSWGLAPLGRLGWAAGFLFVTATAMRLARFNIQAPTGDKRFFVGLPSPAAAAVPATTVLAFPSGIATIYEEAFPLVAMALVVIPALLMVSTIRFRSFKTLDLSLRRSYRNLLGIALVLIAILIYPQPVLLVMAYGYVLSGLLGVVAGRLRPRRRSAADEPGHEPEHETSQPDRSAGA